MSHDTVPAFLYTFFYFGNSINETGKTEEQSNEDFQNYTGNIAYINEVLPVKESFDIIERDMIIGGRESCFFFIDGFMKDEVMSKVMDTLFKLTPEQMPKTATELPEP